MNSSEERDILETKCVTAGVITALFFVFCVVFHGCYQQEVTRRVEFEMEAEKFKQGYVQEMVPSGYSTIWVKKPGGEPDKLAPEQQ